MSATANGFAHAFSTWIAGGNGLNSGKDGVMRYNSGPMRGMTRDAALMKFQNEVWKNAAPEWKDEYAKRATTGMLAPSEQKQAATVPTVTPPMRIETRPGMPGTIAQGPPSLEQMERDSVAAANKPMDTPVTNDSSMDDMPVSRPIRRPATSQPAFGSRAGTGASQTGRVAQVKVGI